MQVELERWKGTVVQELAEDQLEAGNESEEKVCMFILHVSTRTAVLVQIRLVPMTGQ